MLYLSCWSKTQSCWKQRMIWQFASPLYIWLWSATRTKYSSTWKQPQYSTTSKYGWANTFASSLQLFIWFSSHNIPAFIESVSRRSKNKVLWWKYCISSCMYLWLFSKIYFIFTRTLPASCTWNKWRWSNSSVCCNIFFFQWFIDYYRMDDSCEKPFYNDEGMKVCCKMNVSLLYL